MSVRKVVVGVILYKGKEGKEDEFLILHRTLGWKGWEFPKGGVERKDRFEDELALRREIREETGLSNIRILGRLPFFIRYKYPKKYASKYKHTGTVQSVYLVRSFDRDVRTKDEHDDYQWLPYKEARRTLKHTNHKRALDVAVKFLEKSRHK